MHSRGSTEQRFYVWEPHQRGSTGPSYRKVCSYPQLLYYWDDNSRMMPGKKDFKTVRRKEGPGKEKKQKIILNDYMKNLHEKYLAEFPERKISLAMFCRFRPAYLLLVNFASQNVCLCSRHQNLALKLKALKSIQVAGLTNPDSFIKAHDDEQISTLLRNIQDKTVKYEIWKFKVPNEKTTKPSEESIKMRMRLVVEEQTKKDFLESFISQIQEFREHVLRISQYKQLRF